MENVIYVPVTFQENFEGMSEKAWSDITDSDVTTKLVAREVATPLKNLRTPYQAK